MENTAYVGSRHHTNVRHSIGRQKKAYTSKSKRSASRRAKSAEDIMTMAESTGGQKQAEAHPEGIDGVLEAVSFASRGGPLVPQPTAGAGHLSRLLAVHWRLASVACLPASCTLCHHSSLAKWNQCSLHLVLVMAPGCLLLSVKMHVAQHDIQDLLSGKLSLPGTSRGPAGGVAVRDTWTGRRLPPKRSRGFQSCAYVLYGATTVICMHFCICPQTLSMPACAASLADGGSNTQA